jgi:hypothetical protein
MFDATEHLPDGYEWGNKDVLVVVVGDGNKPRTAAMFCHRTAWNAVSIDPQLKPNSYPFKRFKMYRKKIEDVKINHNGPVLCVLPHPHARIKDVLENITGTQRALIIMDCCVKNIPPTSPDIEYVDENVWSPLNTVRVWKNI